MSKWIVVMLVVGFTGISVNAAEEHQAAPVVDSTKKEDVKKVEDKSSKLFQYINACLATPPSAQNDLTAQPK